MMTDHFECGALHIKGWHKLCSCINVFIELQKLNFLHNIPFLVINFFFLNPIDEGKTELNFACSKLYEEVDMFPCLSIPEGLILNCLSMASISVV